MVAPTENETWLIDRGDEVIEKKAECGINGLSPWERLVYCLWVADYSIRNSDNLDAGEDLYEEYRQDLLTISNEFGLEKTSKAFVMETNLLAEEYDQIFESICGEVRRAEPNA